MPRASSPGRALLILALIVLAIFVVYDLSSQDPLLVSLWHSLTGGPSEGEQLRDEVLQGLRGRR